MQKLKDMGVDDNTIVVFTTDNGTEVFTWPDGGQTPFAQSKGTVMEGGFRVPGDHPLARPCARPTRCENGIFSGLDWFPTFVAAAGNPNITEELLKGETDRRPDLQEPSRRLQPDWPLITGKGPSARHEIFYFGESTLGAVRIDDYKYRFIDQPAGWLRQKTHPDVPYLTNLRLDPFERTGWPGNGTKDGAQQYFDWFKYRVLALRVRPAADGQELPDGPRLPADAEGRELQPRRGEGGDGEEDGGGRGGEQGAQPVVRSDCICSELSNQEEPDSGDDGVFDEGVCSR